MIQHIAGLAHTNILAASARAARRCRQATYFNKVASDSMCVRKRDGHAYAGAEDHFGRRPDFLHDRTPGHSAISCLALARTRSSQHCPSRGFLIVRTGLRGAVRFALPTPNMATSTWKPRMKRQTAAVQHSCLQKYVLTSSVHFSKGIYTPAC